MRKRFIPIISLFLLLFSLSLLSYQIFKVPKEVKSIAGTLNITGTTGTFLTPGGIWNSDGSVGIGTTAPRTKLDVSGSNYSLSNQSASIEFAISFPNGVANQKADIYMTGTQAFWGSIETELTSGYANQNSSGTINKHFGLGLNPAGAIYSNESRYAEVSGVTADNFAISDISWDATNSRYKFTIVHRVSTGNTAYIKLTAHGVTVDNLTNFLTFTAGSVYTTDATVYTRPYVHYTGNVGIGTTAPGAKLGFAAATTAAGGIDFGGDTNLYRSAANLLNTDDGFVSAAYMRAPYFQGTAINTLYPIGYATDPGLLVYTGTGAAWSERMRISGNAATANVSFSNSNVGIGTTAPGAKLDVAGTMRSTSYYYQNSNNPSLVLQDSDNRNGVIHQNSDLMYFLSGSGINGTSWTKNGSYWPLTLNMNDDTATFGGPAHFMEGNVGIGTAAPTYKLQVAGTVYASGSSKRFKQNITDLKVNSEKIYDLRPVSFDYKTQYKSYGKQLGEGRQIGLIAEEVYKVIPELSIKLNNEISNVDYEKLSILLLVESKKQKKEINSLKLEIKNLEQRLILVESKLK